MPYDNLERDRPPKGWTAESALGLGLVAVAVVLGAALFLLIWWFIASSS